MISDRDNNTTEIGSSIATLCKIVCISMQNMLGESQPDPKKRQQKSREQRLEGLRSFVSHNLTELQGRPGKTLKEKLRRHGDEDEQGWYMFMHRTPFTPDEAKTITSLDKMVGSAARSSAASSSTPMDAKQHAEAVEARSAGTVHAASSSTPMDAKQHAEAVEARSAGTGHAAADVSMAEEEFHSAAEDNDLPEEDVEMTHGAAEDDDPPEEEFHSAARSSRDDVSMPEEEFHSAAGSSRDDAGVQGSGGCTTFSQWMRMRMASEATEGPITYLQLEERLVHELVEILELEVPDESWKRVPAHVKLFVLVGVCRHQGKLDAREEAFLSDVEGYCFEEVDRVTVDLFSYVFSLTSDDGSTYDDSSWPELIREMPNGLLNSFLGIAASFLCTDSLEDFQAIGRYCRNSSRSIRRRGKNADSAHICSPDAAVETPGATPSHQPQTSQDAETTRPQQDEVHASDEDADSAESSSPAEVAETPSSLDSGSKRPRRE